MGVIVKFPPARMRHFQERIRRIRARYAADRPEDRLAEIDERLRTIDNAIAGLRSNRRAVLAERRAELRRAAAAERRRRQEAGE
jgi:hypothetical protein